MSNYELLCNDVELNNIIDSINTKNKDLLACHGRYHITFVINTAESLLQQLGCDEHTIESGKIASLLHDIGTIEGKKGHALRSSEMCVKYLDKTNLSDNDKNIIIHAIKEHSNGNELENVIGAVLCLVDKVNINRDRVLELGKQDNWHSNLLNIEDVIVSVENNSIITNYIVNDKFSIDTLFSEWSKGITVPYRMSEYLGYDYRVQFNGIDYEINKKLSK